MSDRFVLHAPKDEVENKFNVSSDREDFFEPDYNITPGSRIPVVYQEGGNRKVYNFIWGLIPEGADEETAGRENHVVPIGEIADDEFLTECLAQRRCLIPANGYYKWKFSEKKTTPFYIRLLSNELTAIAGIYSVWESSSGREVYSCAMLTTEANVLVQPVDNRMPIFLHPDDYAKWLTLDELSAENLKQFRHGYSAIDMAVNRVSEDVNDTDNNGEELIQPIPK